VASAQSYRADAVGAHRRDVAVVGGGPIGLACAWRAAQRGMRTVVLDAGEPGAWHVAAGMLAPVAEAEFGERGGFGVGLGGACLF
jgi:glycine oxidase